MRFLLTGGGTAGHINPAIAIAEIIKYNDPRAEIAFVGTPEGMENRLVKAAGYPMHHVRVMGLSRSLSPKNLSALYLALTSPRAARRILDAFRPDAVIGTGGYVSWPLLSAAASAGIPCALHESNALPGLTTRRLAPRMQAVWLNFKESAALLPKGTPKPVHTGNPLRRGFSTLSRDAARRELGLSEDRFFLLSFGGSRGAEAINAACLSADALLLEKIPGLYHVHACGRQHHEACVAQYPAADPRLVRLPYIDRMPLYMGAADLVIARAGAMTISELALCGKCAILIPSPYVADNHQYKNAALLADAGACGLIEERELSAQRLTEEILHLAGHPEERKERASRITAFAMPEANRAVWREIEALVAKKRRTGDPCGL